MSIRDIIYTAGIILFLFIYLGYGYLYNDAEKQAQDIKSCQSVGADWRYSDNNQVLCVKPKKECLQ